MTCPAPERLTPEQRALCERWHPLACQYALKVMRRCADLHHQMDEAEGLAGLALVRAARVYDSGRGAFPTCLYRWVLWAVRNHRHHGARVVHQSEKARNLLENWSLDMRIQDMRGGDNVTYGDLLVAAEVDVDAALDSHALMARVTEEVTSTLARLGGRRESRVSAERSVEIWRRRVLDGERLAAIGADYGVSRQRVDQVCVKVQRVVDKCAARIREEAA